MLAMINVSRKKNHQKELCVFKIVCVFNLVLAQVSFSIPFLPFTLSFLLLTGSFQNHQAQSHTVAGFAKEGEHKP